MTARGRNYTILAVVVCLLVALEIGLNLMRGAEGVVEIVNAGTTPIEKLVVSWKGSEWVLGRVEPGSSTRLIISGRGVGTLALSFNQKGNPLGAFELPGFAPETQARESLKQILRIRTNEVERYQDDSESASVGGWFARGFWDQVSGELGAETRPQ
ncbi:MAG: hypothetical protein U0794_03810 [Isosphaeraceae bacterium]